VVVASILSPNFGDQFSAFYNFGAFLCDLSKCCFLSATGWTTWLSSFLQPADALRYQWDPAHWHGTMLKHNLTSQNLTSRPSTGEEGTISTHTVRFLKYAVTSQIQAANLTLTGYKPYIRGQPNVLAFAFLVRDPASDPYRAGSNGETCDHLPWLPAQARSGLGGHGDKIWRRCWRLEQWRAAQCSTDTNTCKVGSTWSLNTSIFTCLFVHFLLLNANNVETLRTF
jgi:hypothetical protein